MAFIAPSYSVTPLTFIQDTLIGDRSGALPDAKERGVWNFVHGHVRAVRNRRSMRGGIGQNRCKSPTVDDGDFFRRFLPSSTMDKTTRASLFCVVVASQGSDVEKLTPCSRNSRDVVADR